MSSGTSNIIRTVTNIGSGPAGYTGCVAALDVTHFLTAGQEPESLTLSSTARLA